MSEAVVEREHCGRCGDPYAAHRHVYPFECVTQIDDEGNTCDCPKYCEPVETGELER
ncbi:Uncharacterised protein [Mycobacteroides abscessus subsp. abscessus]|jgi:hypothetical protein|nr:Uncharacterised protein [Mycobacteroides abscessus subsp. abscessus]SKL81435.1 Uncharacterised protein [Mycobacteroides abscessus subsp. abscessus]SKM52172.1 Uncharacterised protein [Mycobacteroides abscessus subsp. abscessus]SLK34379.1 Uncharacterised protein [Mycobacteroides abscessus subsp. abscessus]